MNRHIHIHLPARDRRRVRNDDLFSEGQLEQLRAQYAKIESVDPSQPAYNKMTGLLNSLSQPRLKQLAKANVKFVSKLALNRVQRDSANIVVRKGEFDLVKVKENEYRIHKNGTPYGGPLESEAAGRTVFNRLTGDALNHLGEREYQTYSAWRAAAKAAGATRFEGDKDIASAVGADGKHVGEWGGDKGSIYTK